MKRPLPEITPLNDWFWTAGQDGVLRIQGCGDCGKLVHPPTPICPQCRSTNRVISDMSGKAVIVGVVSWSTGPNNAAGCGGLTGVTPLTVYRDWILQTARAWGARL